MTLFDKIIIMWAGGISFIFLSLLSMFWRYSVKCRRFCIFILDMASNYNASVPAEKRITVELLPTPKRVFYSFRKKVPENFLSRELLELFASCPANQQYIDHG